ncbi:hypothetical protein ACFS2C_23560 [Prauserella oleivorans]|uniref:DUF2637 domain-containing protein n=1 Tax=Prauserella oleivorans TaxID=1478153 RepID=A0ABW5WGP0_9PSEU
MSTWREERRKDRVAEAEAKRADTLAAAEAEAVRTAALADAQRAAREQEHAHQQARAQARQEAKDKRRAQRAARMSGLRRWAAGHVVDLLIYPLALVSAVMAIPAMAAYGHTLYGGATGLVLPVLSELGMWAFAVAVQVSRTRTPERPVWALQLGVWLFAGVAAVLNFLHGVTAEPGAQTPRGVDVGLVMGLVSIAGVVAHQLTVAGARRSRAERAEARLARQAARKTLRVRQAAIRQAVAEIDSNGTARLVYAPGRYVLARRSLGQTLACRRRPLVAAVVPGLPVDSTPAGEAGTDWDADLAALLASVDPDPVASSEGESTPGDGGGVGTLDRPAEQPKSTPDRGRLRGRVGRSLDQLRAELRAAIEAGRVDPTSAESIRKTLHCAPKYARQLRDEHRGGQQ